MNPVERSARAKELLESATFKEVYEEVRSDLIAKLETCGFQDIDTQHHLTLSLQLLKQLRTRLERWVDDGKVEGKRQRDLDWRERVREYWKG